jgi:subtilase family serine protease
MRSNLKVAAVLTFLSVIVPSLSFAATTSRIVQPIDSRNMSRLRGSVHPMARPEFDQGALAPTQMLHRVTVFFSRTAAQEQALDQFVKHQQDPSSANFHQGLTPEQFGERFGIAEADLAKVKDWLTSQGFTIDEVSRSRSYIAFSGSVGQISSALQTELHQYNVNGEVHFANATDPSIPTAARGVVAGIRGLTNFRPKPKGHVRTVKPDLTSSLSGNHFMTPDDFATIFNLKALYNAGIDGSGQSIAIMGQTDISLTDISTFRSLSGLPASAPQVVLAAGSSDPGTQSGDVTEADLDIEWAGAVAPKAKIIYVNSSDVFSSMAYAISNRVAPVISISYGVCEPQETASSFFAADDAMLRQATAQNQTIVGPAGDDGAADCDFPPTSTSPPINVATQGLAVDFPASSPNVTGVGGTTFNEGSGTYWFTANNSNNGSALFYMPEIAWNDTPTSVAASQGLAGTGGGVSGHYPKPTWQTGTGVPADGFRDVPDISFPASPGHDGFIICSAGDCQVCVTGDANCATTGVSPGYRLKSDQTFDVAGGTSAGVPAFAGVVALINQKTGAAQGNVNPILYQLASGGAGGYIFHDILSGDNMVPCQGGSPNCPSGGGSMGYTTTPGYDQVTGLGSIDTYNLVTNWNATPAADFAVRFFNSTISVTKGNSVTIPIILQKQNGFNGNVSLSCASALTGVTCDVSPSSANPDATVTVTITASGSASLQAPPSPRPFLPWWQSAFGMAAFFGMANKTRKLSKRQMIVLAVLALALIATLASCGGGGGSSSTTKTTGGGSGGTTTGTSGNVTLTAKSGSLTHTSQITVTVN